MTAMTMRDASRPKLSLRFGAISTPHSNRERAISSPMPTAELRQLVAAMID